MNFNFLICFNYVLIFLDLTWNSRWVEIKTHFFNNHKLNKWYQIWYNVFIFVIENTNLIQIHCNFSPIRGGVSPHKHKTFSFKFPRQYCRFFGKKYSMTLCWICMISFLKVNLRRRNHFLLISFSQNLYYQKWIC